MSLHKGNHVKFSKYASQMGELPAVPKGIASAAQVAALRANPRLRSPFGFCTNRRVKS